MQDYVLMSRLDALRNSLGVVADNLESKVWQRGGDRSKPRAELLGESSLWKGLQKLITEINKRIGSLNQIEVELLQGACNEQAAWGRYAKSLRESEDLLRECLEIIGSLAIRNQDLDDQLLYVADELIRDCVTVSISDQNYYLLVHGTGFSDAFSRTYARIIRLRFPAWTIWNLPLAAHEVGHVASADVLNEERDQDESLRLLMPFMANQRKYLIAEDDDLKEKFAKGGDDATLAESWAFSRLRVLLADAFATYTMGPAYACSAIMLRLNPAAAAQRDIPSDAQRAHVVLSTLRSMNGTNGHAGPYDWVIGQLDEGWKKALDGSPASVAGRGADHLKQLTTAFTTDVAPQIFYATAKYPSISPNGGWSKAQEWATNWLEQLQDGGLFDPPENSGGKLRDVLNAAWLCRLSIKGTSDVRSRSHRYLADAATKVCRSVIQSRVTRTQIGPAPVGP